MRGYSFAPALMNRDQACWYLGDISLRKLDRLQGEGRISPRALDGTRAYLRSELDEVAASLPDWADRRRAGRDEDDE